MKKYFITPVFIGLALFGYVNFAKADVCFLPEGEGCETVPYNEWLNIGGGNDREEEQICSGDCYATETEAMAGRIRMTIRGDVGYMTVVHDSYYKNGDCWCLRDSCPSNAYNLDDKGAGWNCTGKCTDVNSINNGKYSICTLRQCKVGSTTCVEDECHACISLSTYSGDEECKTSAELSPHCPDGYTTTAKPSSGCWNETPQICGTETCYQTIRKTCSGGNEEARGIGDNCACVCSEGYVRNSSNECVLDVSDYTFTFSGGATKKKLLQEASGSTNNSFSIISTNGDGLNSTKIQYTASTLGWVTVTTQTRDTYVINVAENTSTTRRGTITLTQDTSGKTMTINITQCGVGYTLNQLSGECELTSVYTYTFNFSNGITEKTYVLDADGGSINEIIISNKTDNGIGLSLVGFTVNVPDWVRTTTSTSASYKATVAENTSGLTRNYDITLTQNTSGKTLTIHVTQCSVGYSIDKSGNCVIN